jgi:23S rRNA pseudouridine1911/1915/1917 synthase
MKWKRKGEWFECQAPDLAEPSTDPLFLQALEQFVPIPRKLYAKLFAQGGIRQQGNKLLLRVFPDEAGFDMPEYADVEVLFEDDFCLVVNKPAGMAIHPAEIGQSGTLASSVAYHYQVTGQACSIRHIHRLDKDTTGAVLYAKNEWAHLLLDEAMREKRIERIYCGLAQGTFVPSKGTINEPIGKDRHHSGKRRVTPGGDPAVTHYKVLEQFKEVALVQLQLETGRTHQIRVHLSHRGHPLLGDTLYGGTNYHLARQALHGEKLLFCHPVSGENLSIHAPLPDDFLMLLGKLRT